MYPSINLFTICCQCGSAARLGQPKNWGEVWRYFSGAATNKFNSKYYTIQKEILKYILLVQVIVLLFIGPL